jgi:Domain of unknown function (DUF4166)
MALQSLYRRVLGARFESLPEVLKRFHGGTTGGRARGRFRVERGRGRMRNLLASLSGFPPAGEDVPVGLEVMVKGDRERWSRKFPGNTFTTWQWADGELLMERVGSIVFSSSLEIDGPFLRYPFRRAWLLGIPLPRKLSPHVVGWVRAGDDGWQVEVRISVPFFGELVHYEGWVEPE